MQTLKHHKNESLQEFASVIIVEKEPGLHIGILCQKSNGTLKDTLQEHYPTFEEALRLVQAGDQEKITGPEIQTNRTNPPVSGKKPAAVFNSIKKSRNLRPGTVRHSHVFKNKDWLGKS